MHASGRVTHPPPEGRGPSCRPHTSCHAAALGPAPARSWKRGSRVPAGRLFQDIAGTEPLRPERGRVKRMPDPAAGVCARRVLLSPQRTVGARRPGPPGGAFRLLGSCEAFPKWRSRAPRPQPRGRTGARLLAGTRHSRFSVSRCLHSAVPGREVGPCRGFASPWRRGTRGAPPLPKSALEFAPLSTRLAFLRLNAERF